MRTITLTTDFGARDAYVASMKGVILSSNPTVNIVDVSHEIPPQDVLAAGFVLMSAAPYFPRGTIHVAVVDPGVGGSRRPVALERDGHIFVGPDNGVLPLGASGNGHDAGDWHMVHLVHERYWRTPVSRTFHGRDIFAPVAAHLSLGVPLTALGTLIHEYVPPPIPAPRENAGELQGQIIYIDRFGNCTTNLPAPRLPAGEWCVLLPAHRLCGLHRTYGEVARGDALALVGSTGFLEIAVREGSAAERLNLRVGDPLQVKPAAELP